MPDAAVSSHEHVLQGMWHFAKLTLEATDLAAACFERAIAVDPGNAEAHRWRSGCHISRWFISLTEANLAKAVACGRDAVALDPTSARCQTALGLSSLMSGRVDEAEACYHKALMLNPGDPDVLIELGLFNAYAGKLVDAHDFYDRAFRLNPLPPLWFAEFRAVAFFREGRYAEAWPAFAAVPTAAWDGIYGLACLGHLGDRARAVEWRARLEAAGSNRDFLAARAAAEPHRDPEPQQRLVAGLEQALGW